MKTKFHYILMTVAMVAMASCSQDEVLIPSAEVQDIRIVVSDFPAFDDAQTRAIGTFDSGKTAWVPDDVIYIVAANKGVDSQILTLTYGADGEWTADEETLQYLSVSDTHIRAIYAPNCEKEDTEIKAKDNLPYGTGEFLEKECFVENGTLTVDFTNYKRPYSRLRIVTEPNEQITVATTLFDPAGYKDADADAYNYTLTADDKGNAYLYGTFEASGKVEVEGNVNTSHTFTEATDAGNSYALFARRGANLAKMTETYVINGSETHYFYGSGNYGIRVESGSPTIVLSDANISLNEGSRTEGAVNAIDIVAVGSTTTIRVQGGQNNITTKYGAGIFVAQNSSVEITSSTLESKLKINATGGAAIGGYTDINNQQGVNCGHFIIKGITLEAQSNSASDSGELAAIGSSGSASCGTIRIENAIVYAYGSSVRIGISCAPAIGLGMTSSGVVNNTLPTINIQSSEIHLYRGGTYADYIGKCRGKTITDAGLYFGTNGAVKNSKLYCYTGANATDSDAVIQYDMDGNVVNN